MRQKTLALLVVLGFAFISAAAVRAQEAEQPAAPAEKMEKAKPAKHMMAMSAKAETMSGTLTMVGEDNKTVFLSASNGVTYSFVVNAATKVTVDGKKAKMADLAGAANKQVTITFLSMTHHGNIAKSIDVTG
jgi:hypothetical protein